jgi:hypothetical protein
MLFIALASTVPTYARAEPTPFDAPIIFLGSLEEETIFEQSTCEPPPWEKSAAVGPSTDSTHTICVSNSCGYSEAVLRIDRVLAGTFAADEGILRYEVGEWCQSEFRGGSGSVLICIYQTDGLHRFRSEPTYETDDGEVILLESIEQIGQVPLASLLRPLPSGIHAALEGVFITDLARVLLDASWKPRRLALVRDGLGGFSEILDAERVDADLSTLAPHGYQELWDC